MTNHESPAEEPIDWGVPCREKKPFVKKVVYELL